MIGRDESAVETPPTTLSDRLNRLFEVNHPPKAPGRAWRNSEVVSACRTSGRDLSESHLSELRRGVKTNPTAKTLEALGWFFEIRVGYFIDDEVAEQVERELENRAQKLAAVLAEADESESLEREAARELQRALRESGVAKVAHRGARGSSRQRANVMRALAKALRDDDEPDDDAST